MHAAAIALNKMRDEMNTMFYEREEFSDALVLTTLAGQHLFVLGPPGTGKSKQIEIWVGAIVGARHFECAMSRSRPSDAVLGPVDTKLLRETGDMHRRIRDFLPDVEFATIDEIGKMNPITGHDLLAILNERKFYQVNGGRSFIRVPLSSAYTASNELITDISDDSAALWDRLMTRVTVDYLENPKNWEKLLTGTVQPLTNTVAWEDLKDAIQNHVPKVQLSDDCVKSATKLRKELAAGPAKVHVSDRRFRECMSLVRASAFLDGRTVAEPEDLQALRFTFWETIRQQEEVSKVCASQSSPLLDKMNKIRDSIKVQSDKIESKKDAVTADRAAAGKEIYKELLTLRKDLDSILESGKVPARFPDLVDLHYATMLDMWRRLFEQDEVTARETMKKFVGKGDGRVASDPNQAAPSAPQAAAPTPPAPTAPATPPSAATPAPAAPAAPSQPAPSNPPVQPVTPTGSGADVAGGTDTADIDTEFQNLVESLGDGEES